MAKAGRQGAYAPQDFRGLTFHDAARRFADGADTPRAYPGTVPGDDRREGGARLR